MSFRKYISNIVQEVQQKAADFLSNRVNRFSVRKQKIGFLVISLMVGIFCFLLIIGTVGNNESERALKVDSISVPEDIRPLKWDSLKRVPSKVLDSLGSLLRNIKEQ